MAEEACKRKPPWGLPGEGQGDQVNHWKGTLKSTDEETNGTTSSSNGTSSVTNGVSCSDTSCENSVDNCSSSQGKADLNSTGVCVNGVETKLVDVPPTLENIQGINSESSVDDIPQLQQEAISDDVSSDYPDPPDITGDCKDPLEISPSVPHSDVLPPDLRGHSHQVCESASSVSVHQDNCGESNHIETEAVECSNRHNKPAESMDQLCVESEISAVSAHQSKVETEDCTKDINSESENIELKSDVAESNTENDSVLEDPKESVSIDEINIDSSKVAAQSEHKAESVEEKSNTDCSTTESIQQKIDEISTDCSKNHPNEAEAESTEHQSKVSEINTECSKDNPESEHPRNTEAESKIQHCEASESPEKQQRKDDDKDKISESSDKIKTISETKQDTEPAEKCVISESSDKIETSSETKQDTEADEKCDASESSDKIKTSSETKQDTEVAEKCDVSESSGTKPDTEVAEKCDVSESSETKLDTEVAEKCDVSESSETKSEVAEKCDISEDTEEEVKSKNKEDADENFTEDLDVTLEGIEADDVTDGGQSLVSTPDPARQSAASSKGTAAKVTRPCSVDLDTHEITRYLSTHKRRRKWGRPKTKVEKKEEDDTEESTEKKEKKKSPVKAKKPRKPKVVTRTITTRHNPKVAEPEIPPPMLNNRVRLELRRLQLDPLPEKREDSPSPEPPKPKKRGRWNRSPSKQAEVKVKDEPKEETPEPEIVPKKLGRPKKTISPEARKKVPIKKQGAVNKPKVHHKKTFLNLLKKLQKIEMRQKKLGKPLISPKQMKLKGKSPKLNKSVSKDKTPMKNKSPTKDQSPQSDESGKKKLGRPPKFLGTSTPKKDISPEGTKKRKIVRRLKDSPKRRKVEDCETSSIIKDCKIKLENPVTEMLNSSKCNFCKKIFTSKNKYYIRRHLASVHGLEPFCKRCSTIFNNKQELLDHAQSCDAKHNNQNKRLLAALMRTKKRNKVVVEEEIDSVNAILCPYCNKMINHKQNLRRHMHSYHPELEDNSVCYTCPYCHKIVANKYNLQRHMTVLHRDEAFCKFCWELFNSFPELKVHLGKCKNGPHFDKKRRKWECPWESKSITQNLLKFEVPVTEETITETESIDCPIEHEMIQETILYGSVQQNEVDCDNSEFFTQEESTDISFVISEVVEIFTTDDETSDLSQVLACENVISIPPESITHDKGVVSVNLQKGIRIVENWDSSRDDDCDVATADVASVVDLQSLPILTLRNSNVDTDFHRESGSHEEDDRIYQVL